MTPPCFMFPHELTLSHFEVPAEQLNSLIWCQWKVAGKILGMFTTNKRVKFFRQLRAWESQNTSSWGWSMNIIHKWIICGMTYVCIYIYIISDHIYIYIYMMKSPTLEWLMLDFLGKNLQAEHLLPQASWASNLVWVSQHLELVRSNKKNVQEIFVWKQQNGGTVLVWRAYFFQTTIILCEIFSDSKNSVVWWDGWPETRTRKPWSFMDHPKVGLQPLMPMNPPSPPPMSAAEAEARVVGRWTFPGKVWDSTKLSIIRWTIFEDIILAKSDVWMNIFYVAKICLSGGKNRVCRNGFVISGW